MSRANCRDRSRLHVHRRRARRARNFISLGNRLDDRCRCKKFHDMCLLIADNSLRVREQLRLAGLRLVHRLSDSARWQSLLWAADHVVQEECEGPRKERAEERDTSVRCKGRSSTDVLLRHDATANRRPGEPYAPQRGWSLRARAPAELRRTIVSVPGVSYVD